MEKGEGICFYVKSSILHKESSIKVILANYLNSEVVSFPANLYNKHEVLLW
jgi:hypothetical protein